MKGFGVASRLVGLRSFQHATGEYRTGLNSSTAVSFLLDSEERGQTPFSWNFPKGEGSRGDAFTP